MKSSSKPDHTSELIVYLRFTEDDETVLDSVISQIDQSLPTIHEQVSRRRRPSEKMLRRVFKARKVFKDMSENPLLIEDDCDTRTSEGRRTSPKVDGNSRLAD